MSFFDDASLVFLPSGEAGKDGKAYSMKPTDGSGDFTFSRGSNLTATRVDSNGLIEKGRENLLTYSNDFSNAAWDYTTNGVTRTASSIIDPDGGTNAWEITTTATNEHHRLGHTITSGQVKTFSFYAKANGYEYVRFWAFSGGNTGSNYFHLSGAGTAVANGQLGIASIESVGNGWYRCQGVLDPLNSSAVVISPAPDASKAAGTGAYLADGTSGIYLYNAQLEAGLVATEYIESGATTGKAGILEDSPRFDYSGGASCPSLLLEPQRSNIVGFTEYFEGTNWGVGGSTGLQLRTSITSPDGNNGVYLVTSEAENTSSRVQYNLGTLGNDHIFSVFIKGTGSATRIRLRNNTASVNAVEYDIDSSGNFTLNTESALDGYYGADDYGNGWHRVYLKVDTNGGGNNFMQIYSDVVDADGSIYVWGAQAEDASHISSYIPNHSGGSVTRNAEAIVINTLDQTYSTDITLFFEVERLVDNADINKLVFLISDASGGGNNIIQFYSTDNGRMRVLIKDDTGSFDNLFSSNNSFIQGTSVKAAIKITQSGCTLFVDGSSVATTSSVGRVLGIDKINYVKDSIIKQFLLFPSALSDANCITLTS